MGAPRGGPPWAGCPGGGSAVPGSLAADEGTTGSASTLSPSLRLPVELFRPSASGGSKSAKKLSTEDAGAVSLEAISAAVERRVVLVQINEAGAQQAFRAKSADPGDDNSLPEKLRLSARR